MKKNQFVEGRNKGSNKYFNQFIFSVLVISLLLYFIQLSQANEKLHEADRPIQNPPNVLMSRNGVEMDGLEFFSDSAEAVKSANLIPNAGEVILNLEIKETSGKIFNPATGVFDKVKLRSYRGGNDDPKVPFVAPTITIVPGDTVRINLDNQLDANDPSCKDVTDVNKPHCFNSTNLHSHGLWISPAGNSDNVLIKIDPKVNFTYEWNIPVDHPAGTFWYHPHLHGSTALQVSSGMAGALIIKGDRVPSREKNGDIDTLLRHDDGEAFTDRLLVFQQIQYACRDKKGDIKKNANGEWVCDEKKDVGKIEKYEDQFGPGTWEDSGRYTTINGRVMPTFSSSVGEIERWRFVHAGVRATIKPSFRKSSAGLANKISASGYSSASSKEKLAYIDQNCAGPQATQLSLAIDGLTRNRLIEQTQGILQPGYREDLLMVFPETGIYCIIDEAAVEGTVSGIEEDRKILGFVKVSAGKENINNVVDFVKAKLIRSANKFMLAEVRDSIITNLNSHLGLERFVDHKSILANEVTGQQTLAFNISTPSEGTLYEVGNLTIDRGPTNLNSYAHDRIDRDLVLGDVDEWTLKSFFNEKNEVNVGHPFHIHVNPFQIISIKDKDGKELSGYEPGNDSQYAKLQGVWKDTLFIEAVDHEIIFRTRYQRYIGEYVLHCHILDHEDQGMMQNVRISLPDSSGRPTNAHSMLHTNQ